MFFQCGKIYGKDLICNGFYGLKIRKYLIENDHNLSVSTYVEV